MIPRKASQNGQPATGLATLQVERVVRELLTHTVDAHGRARAHPDAAEVERARRVGGQAEGQAIVARLADHDREGGLGAARVIIVELRTGEMSRWMRCHIVWKGDILKTSDGPTQL